MNKEIIKDELRWLLEAINEQFEAIRHYDDKIPQIEFDILMENVRKMYESMRVLQRVNEFVPMDVRNSERVNKGTSEQVNKGSSERESEAPAVTIRFDKPADVEPVIQPVHPVEPENLAMIDPEPELPSKELPFKPVAREVKKETPSRKTPKPAAMDLFAAEEPAFSIKLKEARDKTFGPKIPSERIDNLKAAITINDKFMFINELFEGNLREYNETIETLNGFRTLDQAGEFLDLVKRKNFWDTGSKAFKKLKELIERRF